MTKSNNKQYINMENKKQTAVEWLIAELIKTIDYDNSQNVEDLRIKLQSFIITSEKNAKEMDKQQKMECWETAHQAGRFEGKGIAEENWQTFEQYYNEEYGS